MGGAADQEIACGAEAGAQGRRRHSVGRQVDAVRAGRQRDVQAAVDQQGDGRGEEGPGEPGEREEVAVVEVLLADLDGGNPAGLGAAEGAEPVREVDPQRPEPGAVADRQQIKRRSHAPGAGR